MSQRGLGATVGVAIALLAVVIGVPVFETMFDLDPRFVLGGLAAPTVATGLVVGYLFGRRKTRPEDWSDRILQSLAMAFVATSIGALFVGFAMGYGSADGGANVGAQLLQGVATAFVMWPFGMVLFGVAGMPVTFVAGILWTLAMERFTPADGQVSGSGIHSPSVAPTATKSG